MLVDKSPTNVYLMFHDEDLTKNKRQDVIKVWGEPQSRFGWGEHFGKGVQCLTWHPTSTIYMRVGVLKLLYYIWKYEGRIELQKENEINIIHNKSQFEVIAYDAIQYRSKFLKKKMNFRLC